MTDDPDKPAFFTVCIYLVDRQYGGPEEGGWWYDTGKRCDQALDLGNTVSLVKNDFSEYPLGIPRIFTDETTASHWRVRVQAALDEKVNKGRKPKSSVLSQGVYEAEIHEGWPPEHYPAEIPYYE